MGDRRVDNSGRVKKQKRDVYTPRAWCVVLASFFAPLSMRLQLMETSHQTAIPAKRERSNAAAVLLVLAVSTPILPVHTP